MGSIPIGRSIFKPTELRVTFAQWELIRIFGGRASRTARKPKTPRGKGQWAADTVSVVTAVVATIALISDEEIAGIDAWAYIDAAIFAAIGFGIFRVSRFAATAGLALFVLQRFVLGFQFRGLIFAVILTLAFVNGVRGSFTYHELTEKMKEESKRAGPVA